MVTEQARSTAAAPAALVRTPRNRLAGAAVVVVAGGLGELAHLIGHHPGGHALSETPLAIGLFVVQLLLALAWVAALDSRGSRGSVLIGLVGAGIADGWLADDPHAALRPLAAVAGLGLIAALAHQLSRRPRPDVVGSLAATMSLLLLELALASLLGLRGLIHPAGDIIAAGMFGLAAAALVARAVDVVVRRPTIAVASCRGLVGTVLGIAAAGAAGGIWGQDRLPLGGVGIGVRTAIVAAIIGFVADAMIDVAAAAPDLDDRVRSALAPLTLVFPVALAAPAIVVAGRVLLS